MTSKKILFIDDEKERLNSLSFQCKKFDSIIFSSSLSDYFEFDKAGTSVNLKFKISNFSYLFVHSSLFEPMVPGNWTSLIEKAVGENIIFKFSGGGGNQIEKLLISRDCLYKNFYRFSLHYHNYNEWFIPALIYDDYLNRYGKKLLESLKKTIATNEFALNESNKKLSSLLSLNKESFKNFASNKDYFDALQEKINELQ